MDIALFVDDLWVEFKKKERGPKLEYRVINSRNRL